MDGRKGAVVQEGHPVDHVRRREGGREGGRDGGREEGKEGECRVALMI